MRFSFQWIPFFELFGAHHPPSGQIMGMISCNMNEVIQGMIKISHSANLLSGGSGGCWIGPISRLGGISGKIKIFSALFQKCSSFKAILPKSGPLRGAFSSSMNQWPEGCGAKFVSNSMGQAGNPQEALENEQRDKVLPGNFFLLSGLGQFKIGYPCEKSLRNFAGRSISPPLLLWAIGLFLHRLPPMGPDFMPNIPKNRFFRQILILLSPFGQPER
jgi:hypothetical protein